MARRRQKSWECPVCGQSFYKTAVWNYKIRAKLLHGMESERGARRYVPVCSYSCASAAERLNDEEQREARMFSSASALPGNWWRPQEATPEKQGLYAVKRKRYSARGELIGITDGAAIFIPAGETAPDEKGEQRRQGAHTWRSPFELAAKVEVLEWYDCE